MFSLEWLLRYSAIFYPTTLSFCWASKYTTLSTLDSAKTLTLQNRYGFVYSNTVWHWKVCTKALAYMMCLIEPARPSGFHTFKALVVIKSLH